MLCDPLGPARQVGFESAKRSHSLSRLIDSKGLIAIPGSPCFASFGFVLTIFEALLLILLGLVASFCKILDSFFLAFGGIIGG
jgi:hypothetical protein